MGINKLDGFQGSIAAGLRGKTIFPVKVKHVILNATSKLAQSHGGYDAIGTVFFTKTRSKAATIKQSSVHEDKESATWDGVARPLFSFQKLYPLMNEVVLVISTISKDYLRDPNGINAYYYLPPINLWNHPHHNNLPAIENYTEGEIQTVEGYEKAGLVRRVSDGEAEYEIPLGDYFREQLNLKPLLPYEGDHILEGRFGNSIRFGSTARNKIIPEKAPKELNVKGWTAKNQWSKGTKGEVGDPITIIRNGQRVAWPDEELGGKGWVHTLEDINLDPSSVYLTSNQKIDNFIVSSTNWQTFGANAVIPQSDQKEASKFMGKPVDHMISAPVDDLGGDDEEKSSTTKTQGEVNKKQEEENNKSTEEKKAIQCDNGKWKWGEEGECTYETEESAIATNTGKEGENIEEEIAEEDLTHNSDGSKVIPPDINSENDKVYKVNLKATNKETGNNDVEINTEGATLGDAYEKAKQSFKSLINDKKITTPIPTLEELISTATEEDVYGDEDKEPRYYQKVNDSDELEEIPSQLPENYKQVVKVDGAYGYDHCGKCGFYDNGACSKWEGAKVRGSDTNNQFKNWVCNSWKTSYIDYSKDFPKTFRLNDPKSLNESKIIGTLQYVSKGPDNYLVGTFTVPEPYSPTSINNESYKAWTIDEAELENMTQAVFNLLESQIRDVYNLNMEGRLELGEPLPFVEEIPPEKNWDNFIIKINKNKGMWKMIFDPKYDNLAADAADNIKMLVKMREDIKKWENITGRLEVKDRYSPDPDNYMSGVGSKSNAWAATLSGLPDGKIIPVNFPFFSNGAIPEVLDASDFEQLERTVGAAINDEYEKNYESRALTPEEIASNMLPRENLFFKAVKG